MPSRQCSLLDDALSRSLRTASHGFTYRELNANRIQLICYLIHAILFDNQIPKWDLFNQPLLSENNERYSMRKPV